MVLTLAETSLLRCRRCSALYKLQSAHQQHQSRSNVSTAPSTDCHYKILDINKNATQAEIKAAFVQKSKLMHPDCNPDDPTMHERFVRLNEAYSVLSRATTRREYDFSLAARLAYQQRVRHHQGTHSADSSHMPGSGTYHGAKGAKPFWDETIFEMRDRSKDFDRFYKEDEFYGIKGVRRVSNTHILAACFILMGCGVLLHLAAIQYSTRVGRAFLDERDRKAHAHLENARRRAREHGNAKQLQLLKTKMEAKNGIQAPPADV